jgi:superoxide dismutase, Cu-Zn family
MKLGFITIGAVTVSLTAAGAWAVADEGASSPDSHRHGWHHKVEKAVLHDTDGNRVGKVWMRQHGRYVHVSANLRSVPPGFHGFHVHETGICDPDAPEGPFTSAGGHYNPDADTHGEHAGDLSSVYVNRHGWARMSFMTDAFSIAELRASDGSAVMIHEGRDNYANIPDERYDSIEGPVPDSMTLLTGDAGDRYACGVVD